jgi:hypothetical protein
MWGVGHHERKVEVKNREETV